jgi:hypothetical protein
MSSHLWFISDDGKQAVNSIGDSFNFDKIDEIGYIKAVVATGSYHITPPNSDTAPVLWSVDYHNSHAICETRGNDIVTLPITASGYISKGRRIGTSDKDETHIVQVHAKGFTNCANGTFVTDGEDVGAIASCPFWATSDDPKPDAVCTSYPDGETYNVTVTGHGSAEGVTCTYTKTIPYKAGTWVFVNQTTWNAAGTATSSDTQTIFDFTGWTYTTDGTSATYELWQAVSWTTGIVPPCSAAFYPGFDQQGVFGGTRDCTTHSGGTGVCFGSSPPINYESTIHECTALTGRIKFKYECS